MLKHEADSGMVRNCVNVKSGNGLKQICSGWENNIESGVVYESIVQYTRLHHSIGGEENEARAPSDKP